MDLGNAGYLDQATVEVDHTGSKHMYEKGKLIGTKQQGLFPNTAETFHNGEKVAQTRENILGGIDVIQDGKHTGIIKEDVHGNMSLYDTNYGKIAHLNHEGNIREVLTHNDPLSQANRVNYQQLKFFA
ncbi:hypothetical protein DS745_07495 [Anaerobacillus alkaliphilus]|uniref:Uncharacterized protein n=1 Tax=Anaerobacillus alkaliphilus TaxID=1548597 RepID=A0A4Q0VX64_9BACI|nr:hypothetical protein [Anaerobacillus alkaliphilus]RXJ02225.1 hypothetical protein DS745_07495 [Anaerobacillus alkaliphilus]